MGGTLWHFLALLAAVLRLSLALSGLLLQLFGTLWHSHPIPGTFRHILALSGSLAADFLWHQALSGSRLFLAAGSLWQRALSGSYLKNLRKKFIKNLRKILLGSIFG